MTDWAVIGSAPSAEEFLPAILTHNPRVATVNGAYNLLDEPPDAYGLFEKKAISYYGQFAIDIARDYGTTFYSHFMACREILGSVPHVKIPHDYVYDRRKEPFKGRGLGMGAAALMMLIILEEHKPPRLHVGGVSGYREGEIHSRFNDTCPDTEMPNAETCGISNLCATVHIEHITNRYPQTEVIWYGPSYHPNNQSWRVTWHGRCKEDRSESTDT